MEGLLRIKIIFFSGTYNNGSGVGDEGPDYILLNTLSQIQVRPCLVPIFNGR